MPRHSLAGSKAQATHGRGSVVKVRHGGMSRGKNHTGRAGNRRIRISSLFKPSRPSTTRANTSPALLGPRSIAGNMSIPLSF